MPDDATIKQKMVEDYIVVTPDVSVTEAQQVLASTNKTYCVVMSPEDEIVTVATAKQLKQLPDQTASLVTLLEKLPPAVIIEPNRTLEQIVEDFSPLLISERSIKGMLVMEDGQIEGILPRRAVSQYANFRMRVRVLAGAEIEGDPPTPANIYVCPKGDYQTTVVSYDRHNPPRCPNDKYTLIRKK
jgi:CBS domain-containing protein